MPKEMRKEKKKGRYVWYCLAAPSFKGCPRFDTVEEALADILTNNACSPCCEDEIMIFDLAKNKVIMAIETVHNIETGNIEIIKEI